MFESILEELNIERVQRELEDDNALSPVDGLIDQVRDNEELEDAKDANKDALEEDEPPVEDDVPEDDIEADSDSDSDEPSSDLDENDEGSSKEETDKDIEESAKATTESFTYLFDDAVDALVYESCDFYNNASIRFSGVTTEDLMLAGIVFEESTLHSAKTAFIEMTKKTIEGVKNGTVFIADRVHKQVNTYGAFKNDLKKMKAVLEGLDSAQKPNKKLTDLKLLARLAFSNKGDDNFAKNATTLELLLTSIIDAATPATKAIYASINDTVKNFRQRKDSLNFTNIADDYKVANFIPDKDKNFAKDEMKIMVFKAPLLGNSSFRIITPTSSKVTNFKDFNETYRNSKVVVSSFITPTVQEIDALSIQGMLGYIENLEKLVEKGLTLNKELKQINSIRGNIINNIIMHVKNLTGDESKEAKEGKFAAKVITVINLRAHFVDKVVVDSVIEANKLNIRYLSDSLSLLSQSVKCYID